MRPLLALLLACAACASGSARGLLRIELPPMESGFGTAAERDLASAVEGAAAAEGLTCQPGAGAELLHCAPASLGSQSRGVVVDLMRSGTGYEVSIEQVLRIGRGSPVCAMQKRIADRIPLAMGPAVVHVDTRSDCPGE